MDSPFGGFEPWSECMIFLSAKLTALMREDFPTPEGPAVTDTLDLRQAASSSKPSPEFALKHMA